MFKKISLIFLSLNLLGPSSIRTEDSSQNSSSLTEFVLFWAVAITGATVTVIYAPVVIPAVIANAKAAAVIASAKAATTGAAIKTGSVIVYTKAIAAGTAVKTGCAAAAPVVKVLSPIVLTADAAVNIAEQMPETKLHNARAEELREFFQAQTDFEKCMNKYADQNFSIVPDTCKKEELLFVLLAEANAERK